MQRWEREQTGFTLHLAHLSAVASVTAVATNMLVALDINLIRGREQGPSLSLRTAQLLPIVAAAVLPITNFVHGFKQRARQSACTHSSSN